jgi:hypothetical protein
VPTVVTYNPARPQLRLSSSYELTAYNFVSCTNHLVLGVSSTHRDSTSPSIRTQILSLEILVFLHESQQGIFKTKVSAQDRVTYQRNRRYSRRNLFSQTRSNDDSNFKDNIFENRNACAAANICGLMAWNLVNGILESCNCRYGCVCTEYLFMFLRRLALNRLMLSTVELICQTRYGDLAVSLAKGL